MGGRHKARNIPFELSMQYEDMISNGINSSDAFDRLFEDSTAKMEAQAKEIQTTQKALGASMLREYTKFFQDHKIQVEASTRDRFLKAAIRLRLQLVGHTVSDHSRRLLFKRLRSELVELYPVKSQEFLQELKGSVDMFPATSSRGFDVSHRYAGLKELVDSFLPPTKMPIDKSQTV